MFQTVISALNEGFVQTLKLFVVTLVGSIPLGLIICFGSMSRWAPWACPAGASPRGRPPSTGSWRRTGSLSWTAGACSRP